jgi:hypothetical protein
LGNYLSFFGRVKKPDGNTYIEKVTPQNAKIYLFDYLVNSVKPAPNPRGPTDITLQQQPINSGWGIQKKTRSTKNAKMDRLEILKGMIQSGNDAPEVYSELQKLVKSLIRMKCIDREKGREILSCI